MTNTLAVLCAKDIRKFIEEWRMNLDCRNTDVFENHSKNIQIDLTIDFQDKNFNYSFYFNFTGIENYSSTEIETIKELFLRKIYNITQNCGYNQQINIKSSNINEVDIYFIQKY